jgi:hypothetical protein
MVRGGKLVSGSNDHTQSKYGEARRTKDMMYEGRWRSILDPCPGRALHPKPAPLS